MKTLLLLAASSLLVGCGHDSTSSTDSWGSYYSNQIPTTGLGESQLEALKTKVNCADDECNPSVAMLIATMNDGLGACTTSLIAPDIVVTNSHCIPEDLKRPGASCAGRITLYFPGSNLAREEKAECAEVISASQLSADETSADYAFLRLKAPTSRPVLGFSAAGFSDQSKYTLPKVDPRQVDGHFEGTLRSVSCAPVYDTVLVPSSRSENSPLMVFTNCTVIHGNSGSPILDEKGEIHGVIQATLNNSALSTMMRSLSNRYLDGTVNEMGVGTNLGCISSPALPEHALSPGCKISDEVSEQNASVARRAAIQVEKIFTHIELHLQGVLGDDLATVFEWETGARATRALGDDPGYFVIPKCFKKGEGWLPRYKNFLGLTKGTTSVDVKMPYWEVKQGVNRDMQQDVRLSDSSQGFFSLQISFSPSDFKKNQHAVVTVKDSSTSFFGNSTVMQKDLALCK